MGNTERFVTAILGSPFGLTGRIKAQTLSGEENHLFELKKVILCKEKIEKEYVIEEVFSNPLSIKFEGIDSQEAARALKGAEIIVPRSQAAPLDEGEFYIEDLRGMEVIAEGNTVGIISGLIEGGGGYLAEILLEQGEKKLVPFINEFFGPVDLPAGRIELLKRWILE